MASATGKPFFYQSHDASACPSLVKGWLPAGDLDPSSARSRADSAPVRKSVKINCSNSLGTVTSR